MPVKTRTTLKTYYETNDVPSQAQFEDFIDSAANLGESNEFGGNQVAGIRQKIVTGVTGTLTMADHSGNYLVTAGNVTVPTTAGFTCTLRAGGSHTVSFNSTTSSAMATGDLMSIVVESPTVIKASLLPVASQVVFS